MRKGISSWAIRTPIPTLVLFCVLTIAGVASFLRLPVNANPPVAFPLVSVAIAQPGASPSGIETEVTRVVENALAGLPSVRHVQSTIRPSLSETTVEFQLGTDPDRATGDVRAAIGQIRGDLPQSILEPVVQRVDVEGGAMLQYQVSAEGMDRTALTWLIDDRISRELLSVPGVQRVARFGGAPREIVIEPHPEVLSQYGMSIVELNAQLQRTQADVPGGYLDAEHQRQWIRVPGQQMTLAALAELPIAMPGGSWLSLGQLASLREGQEEVSSFAQLDGKDALGVSIWRAKGSSDTVVAGLVEERLARIQQENPHLKLRLVSTTVAYTKASYQTAMQTLIEGAILTVVVVFFFLKDWRATAIAAVALPLSVLPVFLAMIWLDFTLNSITLLALTLVIGILVDDAIVEIENIDRHIHLGERPYLAALHAADAIALAVLATTLSIVAVFAPVGFIKGVVGQYFRQFGLTASIAVLCSLLVARLLTPLMAAFFLKPARKHVSSGHDASPLPHEPGRVMRSYLRLLSWCLGRPLVTTVVALLLFVGAIGLAVRLPTGFLPVNDSSLSILRVSLPPNASHEAARRAASDIARTLLTHPDVSHVLTHADNPGEAMFNITLHPQGQRQLTRQQFERDVQRRLAEIPDVNFVFLADGGASELSVMLVGDDRHALNRAADDLAEAMRGLPQLANVQVNRMPPQMELRVVPRPDDAARLGVDTAAIGEVVRQAMNGAQRADSARFDTGEQQLVVRVRMDGDVRKNMDELGSLRVMNIRQDGTVPIAAVADIRYGEGEARIDRHDRMRRVSVEANLRYGSLGQALDAVDALPVIRNLPPGVRQEVYGESEYMNEMFENFSIAMAAGIMAMYAVLVLLFKGFMHPWTILTTLPLSLIGALPALWAIGAAIDLPAIIGMLMLMGIVTKNAILLVDFSLTGLREGRSARDAVIHACEVRARPIVMTTVAMVAGMVPAALGFGADAGFRIPMAVAVIGGLLSSTALSLICIPVVFVFVQGVQDWLLGRLARWTTVTSADLEQARRE